MSRYIAAHLKTRGPGDARPTALQIIKDENLLGKLIGKVMLVTGASSGIGIETVRALHATGATIFATSRDVSKGQKVIDEILHSDPENKNPIHLLEMDLTSLESVRKGAAQVLDHTDELNVLVNNAGVMAVPEGRTKDGHETQFGTNHVAHFLLFQLLKPLLLSSATAAFPSRVVNVSSYGHRSSPIRFHDYKFEKEAYNPWQAYGQSKTANIYMANEIERRYGAQNLHATSLHPGGIHTGLTRHMGDFVEKALQNPDVYNYMKSVEQGAATTVYAAISDEWKNKGGKYLSDCAVAEAWRGDESNMVGDDGHAEWVYDENKEAQLWKESCDMVGIADDAAA